MQHRVGRIFYALNDTGKNNSISFKMFMVFSIDVIISLITPYSQSVYTGEFAKGYEHGSGKVEYRDGSRFEGRFRFGKKDGPGVLTTAEGEVIRRIFKENDVYHEKVENRIIFSTRVVIVIVVAAVLVVSSSGSSSGI